MAWIQHLSPTISQNWRNFACALLVATLSAVPSIAADNLISPHPTAKSVRFVWLIPTDATYSDAAVAGIKRAALGVQKWYKDNNNGVTFRLNDPIVEVIYGDHDSAWYKLTRPPGYPEWPDWYGFENVEQEVWAKMKYAEGDPTYKWALYSNVDSRGGGGTGICYLGKSDFEGVQTTNDARWHGGLAHEMGHCLALPDSTYTDGTMMSSSFYGYPNCNIGAFATKLNTDPSNAGFLYRPDAQADNSSSCGLGGALSVFFVLSFGFLLRSKNWVNERLDQPVE